MKIKRTLLALLLGSSALLFAGSIGAQEPALDAVAESMVDTVTDGAADAALAAATELSDRKSVV